MTRLFTVANICKPDGTLKRCHAHMFRDTFAVELLNKGVPIDRVSLLLGHSSVKVTEKHYALQTTRLCPRLASRASQRNRRFPTSFAACSRTSCMASARSLVRGEMAATGFSAALPARAARNRVLRYQALVANAQIESAMQSVPQCKAARPIRILALRFLRMVNAMHCGRDYEADQLVLHGTRQSDVRVMKENGQEHETLPYEQRLRINPNHKNLQQPVWHRKGDLSKVEAQGGRGVEIKIKMVDGMKSPE